MQDDEELEQQLEVWKGVMNRELIRLRAENEKLRAALAMLGNEDLVRAALDAAKEA